MKHPNSEKMIEMGRKFLAVSEAENLKSKNLYFCSMLVTTHKSCGTVACHGGWGSVIFGLKEALYVHDKRILCYCDYDLGADAIAEFIGFKDDSDDEPLFESFAEWASENPELWGNEYGGEMFEASGFRAFGFRQSDVCTIKDIGLHYIQVAERIRQEPNDGES